MIGGHRDLALLFTLGRLGAAPSKTVVWARSSERETVRRKCLSATMMRVIKSRRVEQHKDELARGSQRVVMKSARAVYEAALSAAQPQAQFPATHSPSVSRNSAIPRTKARTDLPELLRYLSALSAGALAIHSSAACTAGSARRVYRRWARWENIQTRASL